MTETSVTEKNTRNGAAVLAIVGAALVIIGTLVTWVSVTIPDVGSSSKSGINWDGSDSAWLIGIACIAALTAIGEITGWDVLPSWVRQSVIWDGIVLVGISGLSMSGVTKSGSVTLGGQTLDYHRSIGAGLWLCLAGGFVVVLAGYTLAGGASGMWRRFTTARRAMPMRTFALGERWTPDDSEPSDPPSNVSS